MPYFYLSLKDNTVELKWFNKKTSRLPQAFLLKMKGLQEHWQLQKMGIWISVEDIIGSPLIKKVGFVMIKKKFIIFLTIVVVIIFSFSACLSNSFEESVNGASNLLDNSSDSSSEESSDNSSDSSSEESSDNSSDSSSEESSDNSSENDLPKDEDDGWTDWVPID